VRHCRACLTLTLTCRLIEKADYFFIAVFSLEYVVRLLVSGNMYEFAVTVPNLVDVVAILPFYVELLMSAVTGAVRALPCRCASLPHAPPTSHAAREVAEEGCGQPW
jgi:hypothetical protein